MNQVQNKKNRGRKKVSIVMLIMFLLLIPSGILMHIYDGSVLNHGKHAEMMIHNLCAIIFVLTGLLHVKYNFQIIKKYFLAD